MVNSSVFLMCLGDETARTVKEPCPLESTSIDTAPVCHLIDFACSTIYTKDTQFSNSWPVSVLLGIPKEVRNLWILEV